MPNSFCVQRLEQDYPFNIFYLNFFLHGCCHWKSQTAHMMLTSRGANLFAESIGMVTVPTDTLVTEYERKEWEKHKSYATGVREHFNSQWWASVIFDFILTPPVLDLNLLNTASFQPEQFGLTICSNNKQNKTGAHFRENVLNAQWIKNVFH